MGAVIRQIWDRDAQELWIYLAVTATLLTLYLLKNQIRIYWTMFHLNGPPVIPILGNIDYAVRDDLLEIMAHTGYRDYGRVSRFWITALPTVCLVEPDDLQAVLGSTKHTRKIFVYRMLANFLGKGLITSDVETWKVHRRLLQPAFHLHVLQKFVASFAECADRLAAGIVKHDGEKIDITKFVNDSVYEILNETVLGVNVANKLNDDGVVDLDDLPFRKGQMVVLNRLIRPWLLVDWIYKMTTAGKREKQQSQDLMAACRKLIQEKRVVRKHQNYLREKFGKENSEVSNDEYNYDDDEEENEADEASATKQKMSLLDFMIQINEKHPDSFSDEDIINECCTFMLAGQDSVGTATAMSLFLLANNPECMEKAVDELNEIFENPSDSGTDPARSPSMQDLKAMRWLECCIKETLRLYPSVPLFARTLGEDVKIDKHVIPAGCRVMILPYTTHRLPHHFPDPDSFRPERFSPENSEKRHPYAYLPFSAGPRNCIGHKFAILEMKAMISAILRRCQLTGVEGKTSFRPKFRFTLRASGGLWVNVTKREER